MAHFVCRETYKCVTAMRKEDVWCTLKSASCVCFLCQPGLCRLWLSIVLSVVNWVRNQGPGRKNKSGSREMYMLNMRELG